MYQLFEGSSGVITSERGRVVPRILENDISMVILTRGMSGFLNGWITSFRWYYFEPVDIVLAADDLDSFEQKLTSDLDIWVKKNPDFKEWFASDVVDLAKKFFEQLGAKRISLKINSRPILDHSRDKEGVMKLYCVYSDVKMVLGFKGKEIDLEPLDVVILKGKDWSENRKELATCNFKHDIEERRVLFLEINYVT